MQSAGPVPTLSTERLLLRAFPERDPDACAAMSASRRDDGPPW
jgi:hypothetical protein